MFPIKKISPFDGMAITAQVWEEAHEYHRQRQQLHDLFRHGPGILTGLEVIASDPPDSAVNVMPGIAIDPLGRVIVLAEPIAYDIRQSYGPLRLLLIYGESQPRAQDDEEGSVLYVHSEFGMYARPDLPETACVELARVHRENAESPIGDAQDAEHPILNEIDQRFRQEIGTAHPNAASIAVCYVGEAANTPHGRGADQLARALRHFGPCQAWVDVDVPLGPRLDGYTLVYLVGRGAVQFAPDEMTAMYNYLVAGGTVLFESCRRDQPSGDPAADAAFADLVRSMGIQLDTLPRDHRLLTEPYLFGAPPAGFETNGNPAITIGNLPDHRGTVIFSTFDYGCLWQGERRDRAASREEIRAATEWGGNIVAYAMERQDGTGRP
jgi:hypothetical protein